MLRTFFHQKRNLFSLLLLLVLLVAAAPSFAQQGENYCRTAISQPIAYGQTLSGVVDTNVNVAFYCFQGNRGDDVTVTVEATSERFIPTVYISDPVFNESDLEDPLGIGQATQEGGTATAEAAIDANDTYLIVVIGANNTVGSFDISLEAESANIFSGGGNLEPTETSPETNSNNGSNSAEEIVLGESNFCRLDMTQQINYGESATGEFDAEIPFSFFCFSGTAGDVVILEAGTDSGDLVLALAVVDPFFDGTSATVYAQDAATSRSDSAQLTFDVPFDGNYVVIIQADPSTSGSYYFEINGEAGTVRDCTSEPLNILSAGVWATSSAEDEDSLIEVRVGCVSHMVVSVLGAPIVQTYEVDRDGNLSFYMGDTLFTSVALDENEWRIQRDDGVEFTLTNSAGDTCNNEAFTKLIGGAWLFSSRNQLILSFTCGDVAVLITPDASFSLPYTFVDGNVTLAPGLESETVIEDVVFEGIALTGTVQGTAFSMDNIFEQ